MGQAESCYRMFNRTAWWCAAHGGARTTRRRVHRRVVGDVRDASRDISGDVRDASTEGLP